MILQLFLIIIYAVPFYLVFVPLNNFVFFVIGLSIGWLLMFLDKKFLFKYYLEKEEQQEIIQYITRSLLFIAALAPLTLYVLTSTGSALAIGIMLSIWLVLIMEMWMKKNDLQGFNQQFLSNIKNKLDQNTINLLVYALTGFFIFISVSLFL